MILPTVRASFGRSDALHLVDLLARRDPELREAARARLEEDGPDSLLDDPRVRNALLTDPDVKAPPSLVFYVLVRQALLEGGVDSASTADFVASVVIAFARTERAYRISDDSDEEFHYLVDMIEQLRSAEERRAFLLRAHLGNYALWLSGLFPDYIEHRKWRRGGPDLDYYEEMGRKGFQLAAGHRLADDHGLSTLFATAADRFGLLRAALNDVSDSLLFPNRYSPERLMRQVTSEARWRRLS